MGIKSKALRRIISIVALFTLLFQQLGFAQMAVELNLAGHFAQLQGSSAMDKLRLPHLRYLSYDNNADNIRIFLDKGDLKDAKDDSLKESAQLLLKYFLIGVTLPDENFWVNLRPDSSENIISGLLEETDIGKIFLEADVQLKKDTAQFTSPETSEGKAYWDKLYQKAYELYGSENVTIPTLTRPWIVPDEIIVRQSADSAYIYKANLKVMLEQDYLKGSVEYSFADERSKQLNEYSSQLIRELILPKLTKEVNNAKRYANLRQVYYSLILARWFKANFSGKSGLYSSYINKQDLSGLTSAQPWSKNTYFKQYQDSFKNGEYNLKVPVNTLSGASIRSYFSGGIKMGEGEISLSSARNSSPIAAFTGLGKLPLVAAGMVPGVVTAANPQSIVLTPVIVSLPTAASSPVTGLDKRVLSIEDIDLTASANDINNVLVNVMKVNDPDRRITEDNIRDLVARGYLKFDLGLPNKHDELDLRLIGNIIIIKRWSPHQNTSLSRSVNLVLRSPGPAASSPVTKEEAFTRLESLIGKSRLALEIVNLINDRTFKGKDDFLTYLEGLYKRYEEDRALYRNLPQSKIVPMVRGFLESLSANQPANPVIREYLEAAVGKASTVEPDDQAVAFAALYFATPAASTPETASSSVTFETQKQKVVNEAVEFFAKLVVNYYQIKSGEIDLEDLKSEIRRAILKEGNNCRFGFELAKSADGQKFVRVAYITPQGKRYIDNSDLNEMGLMPIPMELVNIINTFNSVGITPDSSPVESVVPDKKGGIDFRALPMTIQPIGSFQGLNLSLPEPASLTQINIGDELSRIEKMIDGGIAPSGDRVKELVAACYHKSELANHAEELMLCLIRICKLQEDMVIPAENSLKEAIVIVDSL